jgi:hypothetical protein
METQNTILSIYDKNLNTTNIREQNSKDTEVCGDHSIGNRVIVPSPGQTETDTLGSGRLRASQGKRGRLQNAGPGVSVPPES